MHKQFPKYIDVFTNVFTMVSFCQSSPANFFAILQSRNRAAARKADAEQAVPHADAPTRVWELSERERRIIEELNHKDNERPCAAP